MQQHTEWKYDLKNLLSPQVIAVVGATEKIGPGRNTVRCLLDMGFTGNFFPVHPKHEQVFGLKCYKSLYDLPQKPDLAVISIRAELVAETLRQCEDLGIQAATVYTSGFSEMGARGEALQQELKEIAERAQIRLCGPNCLGHLDLVNNTGAYSASILAGSKPGPVAVISQSGSMAISMYQAFKELGLSHVISYGNQAVLDLSDYLMFLARDPHTKIITTFIEGVNNGSKFIKALEECRKNRKAVVALKIGKSEIGKKIAMLHTAALVGSEDVYEEVFAAGNVLVVKDIDEMLQTVSALVKTRPPRKSGLAVLAISGGHCGLMGDMAEKAGLNIPEFSAETVQGIREIVPPFVNVRNPLDVSSVGSDDYREYAEVLTRCVNDDNIGITAVIQDAPYGVGPSTVDHYSKIAKAVMEVAARTSKPIIVFTNHSTPYEPKIMQGLIDSGLTFLQGTPEAVTAIKHLLSYYLNEPSDIQPRKPVVSGLSGIRDILLAYRRKQVCLGEREGKNLLERIGIPVTRDVLCKNEADIRRCLPQFAGPVALKIDSQDILHKTDVGGVALGISGEDVVMAAYRDMLGKISANAPGAVVNGVVMQEMVPEGVDLIIGVKKDAQFGPVLLFGLGGIYVEVFRDRSIGLVPVDMEKARQMIRSSKSYALLKEVRGRKAFDTEPLAEILTLLSDLMEECGDLIKAIDLNPVRIGDFGVKVLDCLISLEE